LSSARTTRLARSPDSYHPRAMIGRSQLSEKHDRRDPLRRGGAYEDRRKEAGRAREGHEGRPPGWLRRKGEPTPGTPGGPHEPTSPSSARSVRRAPPDRSSTRRYAWSSLESEHRTIADDVFAEHVIDVLHVTPILRISTLSQTSSDVARRSARRRLGGD
jgi:hypothetical protein